MEHTESDTAANELEIIQVVRVDTGCRADLQSIVVVCRVLKETVGRIKDLMRKQEEKFPIVISQYCN